MENPDLHASQSLTPQIASAEAKHPVSSTFGRVILGTVFAALALFLFVKLADEVMETETQHFDTAVIRFFQQHPSPLLHALMTDISWLASGWSQTVVIFIAALVFLWKRRFWPDGVAMLLAGFGGMWLDELLKGIFHRQRPDIIFYSLGYSFPSGHSFSAVAVYGMIAYGLARKASRTRRLWIWGTAMAAILLVGFSRIYLGQHYPTDVLGGYAAGLCWLWGCLALPMIWGRREQIPLELGIANTEKEANEVGIQR